MKKYICMCLATVLVGSAAAQTKKTELYDLLKSLIPDNTATTISWSSPADAAGSVKWKSAPRLTGRSYYREGTAAVTVDGKSFGCINEITEKKHSCSWRVSEEGNKQSYSRFTISTEDFPGEGEKAIGTLFKKNMAEFKPLKVCNDGAMYWMKSYAVNIPGKKAVWVMVELESASATASQFEASGVANYFRLTVYLNKKELDGACQ